MHVSDAPSSKLSKIARMWDSELVPDARRRLLQLYVSLAKTTWQVFMVLFVGMSIYDISAMVLPKGFLIRKPVCTY